MKFPQFIPGDRVKLEENDCFGGVRYVTVVKVFKGGNARVKDGNQILEVSVNNLTALPEICPNCGGAASCRCCETCGAMTRESCTCCECCGGAGKVSTMDHESYFGANYKPCPKCGQDACIGEPPVS